MAPCISAYSMVGGLKATVKIPGGCCPSNVPPKTPKPRIREKNIYGEKSIRFLFIFRKKEKTKNTTTFAAQYGSGILNVFVRQSSVAFESNKLNYRWEMDGVNGFKRVVCVLHLLRQFSKIEHVVLEWSSQGATIPSRYAQLRSTNCIISDQSTLSAWGDSPCPGQCIDLYGDSLLHLSSLSLSASHSLLGPLISHLFTSLI